MCLRKENLPPPVEQDNTPAELDDLLARSKRLVDPALAEMTIDSIRQLVREIEDKLAEDKKEDGAG